MADAGSAPADISIRYSHKGRDFAPAQNSRDTDVILTFQKLVKLLGHFCADLLPQQINRYGFAITAKTPIGPSVTAWRAL